MPTDYIKAADLHAALARVRDETKAKVWAEAYAAGQKAEQEQYAKAVQLVTLGRALGGLGPVPAVVTQQFGNTSGTLREQPEPAIEAKAFVDNPALPRRENPDGPAYGKLLQLTEGWVHPDGAVTVLNGPGEAHVAALAEADPDIKKEFHAAIARHQHRKHPAAFVDDDVKDHAFDKGFVHITGQGRTIEATGKHEMLLKHRKFLKDLAMRATTLVFRPVDGDDYEVKAKTDRERKSIPADPNGRTEHVMGTHYALEENPQHTLARHMHADALSDDAGEDGLAAVHHYIASIGTHDEPMWRDNLVHQFGGNASRAAQAVTRHAVEHLNALHPDDNTDNTPDWHVSAYLDGRQAHRAADEAVAGAPPFLYRDQSGNFKPTPETDPVRLERFRTSRHADARHYHQNVVRAAERPDRVQLDHYDNNGEPTQPPPPPPMTAPEHLQHVALLHHAAAEIHRYAATTPAVETKAIPHNPAHRTEAVIGTHHAIHDALARGDTGRANYMRQINADALDDAGAVRESTLERVLSGVAPPAALAATFKNAANLKRAARSRTEAAHTATQDAYQSGWDTEIHLRTEPLRAAEHSELAFEGSHGASFFGKLGELNMARDRHQSTAAYHDYVANKYAGVGEAGTDSLAALHRHAAEQHRIAAAYNAAAHHADSQRTVKAQEDYHPRFRDELHDAGREHEMEGPPTPGLRSQEAYVVSDRLMDEALHTHGLHVPYSSLENAHEKAFDAADIGDDAGRRYWHRRARDLHILMRGQLGATPGDPVRQAHEKAMSLHGKASADGSADRGVLRAHASLSGDEQAQVAHAIGNHGGDVSAAAHTATAAANKLTDPEKDFGTVAQKWGVPVVPKSHTHAATTHAGISEAIPQERPYRPMTAADVMQFDTDPTNVKVPHPGYMRGPRLGWVGPESDREGHGGYVEYEPVARIDHEDGSPHLVVKSSQGHSASVRANNMHEYSVYDADTGRRRTEAKSAHRVASYLHQEAATGDHLNREVKAVRWNQARAEQHEPHVPDGNYAGDYDEDDAGSEPVHSAYYRSNALLDKSTEHVNKLADRYPHLNPRQVNENMLDAADLGDEAGHRYWKRRLGDVHLMLWDLHDPKDSVGPEHGTAAARLYGTNLNADIQTPAAHLIAHHKGDVGAAARHASEAAIKATDPALLNRHSNDMAVAQSGFSAKDHVGQHREHDHAAMMLRTAPDTYRPLTHADIEHLDAGTFQGMIHTVPAGLDYEKTVQRGQPAKVTWGPGAHEFSVHSYNTAPITHENIGEFYTEDTDARQHRLDLQQMHTVAALLHREAATGDHEKREVKASNAEDTDEDPNDSNPYHATYHRTNQLLDHAEGTEYERHFRTHYPQIDVRQVNENAFDAVDSGDTVGHRYWRRRLGDAHLLMAQSAIATGDENAAERHHAAALQATGKTYLGETDTVAAHLVVTHGGDVPAAAKTATETALRHTDPAILSRGIPVDPMTTREQAATAPHRPISFDTDAEPGTFKHHSDMRTAHAETEHAFRLHPRTYRPLNLHDIDGIMAGTRLSGIYSAPDETGERDMLMHGKPTQSGSEFHIPVSGLAKFGYKQDAITHENYDQFHTVDAEAHQNRVDTQTLHAVARTLHDEAAYGTDYHLREVKSYTDDPAPHGYCPGCYSANITERECPACGPFDKSPKYSYAGVELKGEMADYLRSAGAMIPDADLAKDGRETNPHVTVRYGLHENDGAGTHETLSGAGPVAVQFASELAMFSNKDADVIHVPVRSGGLRRLNGMLAALPHTDTHDEYKPHATIAYVKSGLGAKYIKELPAPPAARDTVSTVTFSNPAKTKRVINLEPAV